MADRAQPLTAAEGWGLAAAALAVALVAVPLLAVGWRAGGIGDLGPSDWAALRFTVLQAALSAGLSVGLAVPVARALARRRFAGRSLLISLLGAPFILPVIVAVLGLLALFGRGGVLNAGLEWLGLPGVEVYGLHGVVLAHVFFNLPLATRLILHGWLAIPAERFRLAASLGFSARDIALRLEWPMLREVVPGAALTVFLICLTSFAVALTLGGGPGASTLELAIYQAFRFDFDLGRVAVLGLVQVGLCATATAASLWLMLPAGMAGGLDRRVERWDTNSAAHRVLDALVLVLATVFLIVPIGLVAAQGVPHIAGLPQSVWAAAGRSVLVALAAAGLAVGLGIALSLAALRFRVTEVAGMLSLAASPLVMGAGMFLVLRPWTDPASLALVVTALVNAVTALPLVLRSLLPELRGIEAGFGKLADSLALTGWLRLRWLILPRLRRPLGFAAGLAASLSMGDLGVIALFSDPARATLPLQVYALMGAYRMDLAIAAAVLLAGLSLGLFWVCDRWGRYDAGT